MPPEDVLDPALPIVDAHHHLWYLSEAHLAAADTQSCGVDRDLAPVYHRHARYLLDEFLADAAEGHNVRASVFVDARTMYRARGPERLKSVGEVEFVNGIAAAAASGTFGDVHACAAIVGGVDLKLGDAAQEVLVAHIQAGNGRYRGVRSYDVAYDEDPTILGAGVGAPNVLTARDFREGFKWLRPLGLSFDVFLLEPQLPDLIDLAQAFPDTQIILDHLGTPVGVGKYAGQREARFPIWRSNIRALARCPNVAVKLGGLGLPVCGFKSFGAAPPATSSQLAREWKPYIETCIEEFGAERCMFASNYPVDAGTAPYSVLWNTFKRIVNGSSGSEKRALFCHTAARIYSIEV